jgi:hypothetical protein
MKIDTLIDDATGRKISQLPLVPRLPNWRGPDFGRAMPRDLCGSEIVRVGTIAGVALEGGGLVIDYRTKRSAAIKRIAFSFNELGMWVSYHGVIKERPNPDADPK